ncbi:MAG: alpha-N-arabinofuranosidase [Bacteroidaceae bacterium]|nr:alpha-N-arabinofuranosidase [Bacteroidaceae bacterium]
MKSHIAKTLLCASMLFSSLCASAQVTVSSKDISPLLVGAFFEDLNYAADGGLYGELLENRSFEYTPSDIDHLKNKVNNVWNSFTSWQFVRTKNSIGRVSVETAQPIHPNNPHYVRLRVHTGGTQGAGMRNLGYDGICVDEGKGYNFSIFVRTGNAGIMLVRMLDGADVLVEDTIPLTPSGEWAKYACSLQCPRTTDRAAVEVLFPACGVYDMDMMSLFPCDTYKGRPNGLRNDIARHIEALRPAFMRFPGGCLAHGDGLDNIYYWKESVGPVEERLEQPNIWSYRQSRGLGYHEYLQLCEDIGAEPLPIVAAGVSCQNSARRRGDGQEVIPMDEMDAYIQDIIDLVEYCNGDTTTVWGKKRAEAGHPAPFGLKYIGIGNEDHMTPAFEERFAMIVDVMRERCPEIMLIGTSGPAVSGRDFDLGWDIARKTDVWAVDEHCYASPEWFLDNLHRYDNYPRTGPKVYLGEWASRGNTWWNALCEAAFLCHLERNGDVVAMASYAPLLAHRHHIQWKPDLIFFDERNVYPTVNYDIQRMYAEYRGDRVWSGIITDAHGHEPDATSCVTNSTDRHIYIRLVNTTDQPVQRHINLAPLRPRGHKATIEMLQAERTAQNTPEQPQVIQKSTTTVKVRKTMSCELPPYSVTFIKI